MKFYLEFDTEKHDKVLGYVSPFSPVMVNIYLEYFKEMVLGTTPLKTEAWL